MSRSDTVAFALVRASRNKLGLLYGASSLLRFNPFSISSAAKVRIAFWDAATISVHS